MVEEYRKAIVEIAVRYLTDGKKIPLSITFEDGKRYAIDRLCDTRQAACMKVGGTGIRYAIAIAGRKTLLFEDEDLWWVEARTDICESVSASSEQPVFCHPTGVTEKSDTSSL